ncbi:MAG: OmpA family protein, partial [Myxococcales bacterium]|nr:OmpA family protein [Myxococcales bacterium]
MNVATKVLVLGTWLLTITACPRVPATQTLDEAEAEAASAGTDPGPAPTTPAAPVDGDGDGIDDRQDQCPHEPEDRDGFVDEDGCPEPDNDGDGLLDTDDACPNEPEVINGVVDDDGCPDEGEALVALRDDRIELLSPVEFEINKAQIRPRSYPILDQVVTILRHHPQLRLRIEGHRDNSGDWSIRAAEITDKRAQAVLQYLVDHGIDPERLRALGYGADKPI